MEGLSVCGRPLRLYWVHHWTCPLWSPFTVSLLRLIRTKLHFFRMFFDPDAKLLVAWNQLWWECLYHKEFSRNSTRQGTPIHTPELVLTFPSTGPIRNTEFRYLEHVNREALDQRGESEPYGCANPLYFSLGDSYTHVSTYGKAHWLNHYDPVCFTHFSLYVPSSRRQKPRSCKALCLMPCAPCHTPLIRMHGSTQTWDQHPGWCSQANNFFGTETSNTRPQSCWHQESKPLLMSYLCHSRSRHHLSPLLSLAHWLGMVRFASGQHDSPLGRPFF